MVVDSAINNVKDAGLVPAFSHASHAEGGVDSNSVWSFWF